MLLTTLPGGMRMQTLPPTMITLLAPFVPLFSQRVWRHALVLVAGTLLAPGKRTARAALRAMGLHQTKHWTRRALLLLRRGLPGRAIVVVADGGYAAIALLARCARLANPITIVTRLRLDAALYAPAPPRRPGQLGRPRKKGQRLPTLAARL